MKSITRKLGHREIFELVRRDILAGKYDGENKLPSETALARKFGVGRQTMGRMMLDLNREGLVVTHQGAPTRLSKFARNATGALAIVFHGTELALCEEI